MVGSTKTEDKRLSIYLFCTTHVIKNLIYKAIWRYTTTVTDVTGYDYSFLTDE